MFERLKGVFAQEPISDVETENTTIPLAAAMLLLEVAWADHELEDRELEQVKVALDSMYEIDQDQVAVFYFIGVFGVMQDTGVVATANDGAVSRTSRARHGKFVMQFGFKLILKAARMGKFHGAAMCAGRYFACSLH